MVCCSSGQPFAPPPPPSTPLECSLQLDTPSFLPFLQVTYFWLENSSAEKDSGVEQADRGPAACLCANKGQPRAGCISKSAASRLREATLPLNLALRGPHLDAESHLGLLSRSHVGASPEETAKMRLEEIVYKEKLRWLGLISLEKGRQEFHRLLWSWIPLLPPYKGRKRDYNQLPLMFSKNKGRFVPSRGTVPPCSSQTEGPLFPVFVTWGAISSRERSRKLCRSPYFMNGRITMGLGTCWELSSMHTPGKHQEVAQPRGQTHHTPTADICGGPVQSPVRLLCPNPSWRAGSDSPYLGA